MGNVIKHHIYYILCTYLLSMYQQFEEENCDTTKILTISPPSHLRIINFIIKVNTRTPGLPHKGKNDYVAFFQKTKLFRRAFFVFLITICD